MVPVAVRNATGRAPLLLTCEHASAAIPAPYANLGLAADDVFDHIGWDIGAAWVTDELSLQLDAPAVLSSVSRLLVDCNRPVDAADLMPAASHGVSIPGNADLSPTERAYRLAAFYDPYHETIDGALAVGRPAFLLSVHSFTPALNGAHRPFDIGVLYDDFEPMATALADRIAGAGLAVRMNEPYSGLDGLIFSARRHGRRHDVPYLEIEINNALLRREEGARELARRLVEAVRALMAERDHTCVSY